jgi:enolase
MNARRVTRLHARRVWDSRGQPTVEVELHLASGARGRGIAPAGASTGRHEAVERRDREADPHFGGRDVHACLAGLRERVAPALVGGDGDPDAVDARLETIDASPGFREIGGNAAIAVSLAARHADAAAAGMPLWRRLADGRDPVTMPRPQIQVIGGGAHAAGRLDLQDLMIVPLGEIGWAEGLDRVARIHRATRALLEADGRFGGWADEGGFWPWFEDDGTPLEVLARGIEAAGLRPGEDAAISVDVAASQLVRGDGYRLALEDRDLDTAAFADWLAGLVDRLPIRLLEDPFDEDDVAATGALLARVRGRCRIVGDDLAATSTARIRAAAGAVDAVLIKPNQAGTVARARDALDAARAIGALPIVSARSGETEAVDVVDLAVGWGAPMIKVGALARGERTAKWNHGLRIAEALGDPPLAAVD